MNDCTLPPVKEGTETAFPHFPSRFHAAVFRLWETVPAALLAAGLGVSPEMIAQTAAEMGLPAQRDPEIWLQRGYITTIRNAWHLLPYDQLLGVLGWDKARLATVLKEEDALEIKLGGYKPECPPVRPEPLNELQKARLERIRAMMEGSLRDLFSGARPFDFFAEEAPGPAPPEPADGLRMVYSYCGLYADALDQDPAISYPDALLRRYRAAGINAVWLPVILYQMTPFPFDERYSAGWELRQKNLNRLIERASRYGIRVYLYLNEPRCMPRAFFEKEPALMGSTEGCNAALCTSDPRVMNYLRRAVRALCEAAPGLGGFFLINCSEALTHCKSRKHASVCPRCREKPIEKTVAEIIAAVSEESRRVDPAIQTVAWTWAWEDYVTPEEMERCIRLLPREVIVQCNSEAKKEFTVGGVAGRIRDYSMSIPGPSAFAENVWRVAAESGHAVSAKVQVNTTWECSTVPFLPVFDLIREHMTGLKKAGVRHLMLSWTLGGWPAVNLAVASAAMESADPEAYRAILRREYGDFAPLAERAATVFSEAFREFPFDIRVLYYGPQNAGPSNPLYAEPSGRQATMTCFAYDDLETWRSVYPRPVFLKQWETLCEKWKRGLDLLAEAPDCDFVQMAKGGYLLFRSTALQVRFVMEREKENRAEMRRIAAEERQNALAMLRLMQKNSAIGFEAANHYYFNRALLAEKALQCAWLEETL